MWEQKCIFNVTNDISHTYYNESLVEAGLLPNKGWFLLEIYSLQFDLITFGKFKVAYATDEDDYLNVGKKWKVEDTRVKMMQKPQYGKTRTLYGILGEINTSNIDNGDRGLNQKQYFY